MEASSDDILINAYSGQNQPDHFDEIFQANA